MPALTSVRGSRLLVAVAAVVLVAAAATIVVTSVVTNPGSPATRRGARTSTSVHGSTTTTTTTTAPPITRIGTYPVATTSLTVHVGGLSATDDQLPTTVWYPTTRPSTGHRAAGRYPLLVFSQGFDVPVSSYSALVTDWASAGFVVAGPTYPHTAPSTPTTLDRADLVHHPVDLRAVITTMIDAGHTPRSVLSGRINGLEVGLVGQSDGGDVSLAVADNSCCRITGVKATAILSGAEYENFGGQYFEPGTPVGPPLLVVQGTEDTINPPVCSEALYDAATAPKYYLDLLDATHLGPYTESTSPYLAVVASVTTDFFEGELAGQRAALARMTASGDVPGVTNLSSASMAPPAYGTCPTAP